MTTPLALLIVEDLESDAQLIVHQLRKAGYDLILERVETLNQMRAALEQRTWDIVISDYSLPQFDGRTALELLRESGQDIPFILVSGAIGEETAVSMMKAGAHDYLMKGDLTRLAPAVERELAQAKIRREQQQAEVALLQSEERYRLLVELLPVVIYRDALDELATTQFISPQIERLTGYSAKEWIADGTLWFNLLHPDDRERVLAENRRHNTGHPFLSEYRLIARDGHVIWVRDEAIIIRDAAGQPLYSQGVLSDITERKQAEEEIARMALMLDVAPNAITVHDFDGRFLYANRSNFDLHGYDPNEFMSLNLRELDTPESARLIAGRMQELLDRGEAIFQVEHLKKDGTPLLLEIYTRLTTWGDIKSILSIATDITKRKQAEEALRASEERFHTLYDNATIGLYRTTPGGRILMLNPAGVRMLGYGSLDEIAQRDLENPEFQSDDLRKEFREKLEREGTIFGMERKMIRKDGSTIFVRESAKVFRDENGEVLYYDGSFEDVTERVQAEDALRIAEANYRAIFEHAPVGIFQSTPQGRYLSVNPAMAHIYGYDSPDEMIASITDIAHQIHVDPSNRQKFRRLLAERGEVFEFIGKNYRKDGSIILTQTYARTEKDAYGNILYYEGFLSDITERKRAEQALAASEAELRALFASMQDVVLVIDQQGLYLKIAPTDPSLLVKPPEELLGKTLHEIFPPQQAKSFLKTIQQVLETQQTTKIEYPLTIGNRELWFETSISPMNADSTLWVARDVTERKKAEESLRQRLTELEMLYESGLAFSQLMNPKETAQKILDLIEQKLAWQHTTLRLYHPQDETLELLAFHQPGLKDEKERQTVEETFKRLIARAGEGLSGWAIQHGQTVRSGDVTNDPRYVNTSPNLRSGLYVPMIAGKRKIGVISIESEQSNAFSEADERLIATLATQAAFALENARLFEETRQRVAELETLHLVSTALRAISKQDEMLAIVLDQSLTALHTGHGAIILWDEAAGGLLPAMARGWLCDVKEEPTKPGEGIFGKVFVEKKTYISRDFSADPLTRDSMREQIPPGWGGACVPIRSAEQTLGVLLVAVPKEWELTKDEVRQVNTLAEMTGTALHRMRLHAETAHRLEQLQALRAVDQAISSNFDLRPILDTVLHHTLTQLRVDAAAVLLLLPGLQVLEYAAGHGFRTKMIKNARVHLGKSFAGKAALERRTIQISNPAGAMEDPNFGSFWLNEGFASYCGVPLIAKGEVKGVLEIFHRAPLPPEPDWMDYLETLAKQTAIAIDNTRLFEGLQQANLELALAYEATIEGWSRALDLRDQETENHTRRVTRAVETLSGALGISPTELVHVRRGALLHDIGKMGVPDNILLKQGLLTDEERAIIQRHPQLAYEMLSPIAYLHQAIEIPYCHHEKWDGSGYPRGLKGEQIPLAARIFTVVDVWDALTSDRPYRKAWSKKKTLEYIREQSGRYFDPQVVKIFLENVENL